MKKIVYAGGGTLGSVTPLLAVHEELSERSITAHWIGTRRGPERALVERAGLPFTAIASGKVRRYLHWRNFIDPFLFLLGFFQSIVLLVHIRPQVIVSAGSFVSAPVIIAGWLLRLPSVILQLDIEPVRTNLLITPFVRRICIAVPETARHFPQQKTIVTGIPTRRIPSRCIPPFVSIDRHTLVVVGGGTGAQKINELVLASLGRLTERADVIHYTGLHKEGESKKAAQKNVRYHPRAFDEKMITDLAAADVVVTRAGMGTLAELAALAKPSIVIPIPHSPQEKNAAYFKAHDAVLILSQVGLSAERFCDAIIELFRDLERKRILGQHISHIFPSDAALRVATCIREMLKKS